MLIFQKKAGVTVNYRKMSRVYMTSMTSFVYFATINLAICTKIREKNLPGRKA